MPAFEIRCRVLGTFLFVALIGGIFTPRSSAQDTKSTRSKVAGPSQSVPTAKAESDAEFVNRKHPDDPPVEPLYTVEDADAAMKFFRAVPYRKPTNIGERLVMAGIPRARRRCRTFA